MKYIRSMSTAILILLALLPSAYATRIETENIIFKGSVIVSNQFTVGNSNLVVSGDILGNEDLHLTNSASVMSVGATNNSLAKVYIKGNNGSLSNMPLLLIEGSTGRNNDFIQITGNAGAITNFRVMKDGTTVTSNLTVNGILNIPNYSFSSNLIMTASASSNFTVTLLRNNAILTDAKLYVANTNVLPYGAYLRYTFYSDTGRKPSTRIAQFDTYMAVVSNTLAYAIGVTNLPVPDTTAFSVNDLIKIVHPTDTNEYVTIAGFLGTTNIITYTALTNYHNVGSGVSRVNEIGMVPTRCDAGCSNIYVTIERTNGVATTVNTKFDGNYR